MRKSRRDVLYKSESVQLERINIMIGSCHTKLYREIIMRDGELEVREHKSFPEWYIRELKLQMILDDRD